MANRYSYQFVGNNTAGVVNVFGQITFGASGAPTLATTGLHGNNGYITSVVRNSAGDYTITLTDVYNALLQIRHVFNSGASAPAAPGLWIKTDAVTTKSLRVVFNSGGTATDPATGEIVLLQITLKNSSI